MNLPLLLDNFFFFKRHCTEKPSDLRSHVNPFGAQRIVLQLDVEVHYAIFRSGRMMAGPSWKPMGLFQDFARGANALGGEPRIKYWESQLRRGQQVNPKGGESTPSR